MKYKKGFLLLVLTTIVMIMFGCSNGSGNETNSTNSNAENEKIENITLKFGHTFTADNHKNKFGIKLGEILEEKTNGHIKVEMYPSSQLGDDIEMIEQTQSGDLEMTMASHPIVTNFMKEAGIFSIPYLFDNQDQMFQVLKGEVGDYFKDKFPEYDLVSLGYIYPMERNIMSKKPLKNADDFKGFKIRELESPGFVKGYESLGAHVTTMGYSEVFTSMQQGVVDAATGAPDQIFEDGFDELISHYIRAGINTPMETIVMSKKVWDNLSSEQQKVIEESVVEALEYQKEVYQTQVAEAIEKLGNVGIEVINPEDMDLESIKSKISGVKEDLLKDVPDGDEIYKMIEKAKEQDD